MREIFALLLFVALCSCSDSEKKVKDETLGKIYHKFKYFSIQTDSHWEERVISDSIIAFVHLKDTNEYRFNFTTILFPKVNKSNNLDSIVNLNLQSMRDIYPELNIVRVQNVQLKKMNGKVILLNATTKDKLELGAMLYFIRLEERLFLISFQASNEKKEFFNNYYEKINEIVETFNVY